MVRISLASAAFVLMCTQSALAMDNGPRLSQLGFDRSVATEFGNKLPSGLSQLSFDRGKTAVAEQAPESTARAQLAEPVEEASEEAAVQPVLPTERISVYNTAGLIEQFKQ